MSYPIIEDGHQNRSHPVEIRPFSKSLPIIIFRAYLLTFILVVISWILFPDRYLSVVIQDDLFLFIFLNKGNLCIVFGLFPAVLLVGLDQAREKKFRKYRSACDSENYDPGDRARFYFRRKLIDYHDEISFYLIRFTRVEHNTLKKFNFTIVENLYRVDSDERGGEFFVEVVIPEDSISLNGGTLLLTVRALQCHNYALMAIFDGDRLFYGIPQSIDWEV